MNEQIQTTQEEMRPCENCKGMTKKNLISPECWECGGEGAVEDDDPLTSQWFWRKCWNCDGKGYLKIMAWYCSTECYEMNNDEDFCP